MTDTRLSPEAEKVLETIKLHLKHDCDPDWSDEVRQALVTLRRKLEEAALSEGKLLNLERVIIRRGIAVERLEQSGETAEPYDSPLSSNAPPCDKCGKPHYCEGYLLVRAVGLESESALQPGEARRRAHEAVDRIKTTYLLTPQETVEVIFNEAHAAIDQLDADEPAALPEGVTQLARTLRLTAQRLDREAMSLECDYEEMDGGVDLLRAELADRDNQIALMLKRKGDSYSKGYYAGLRCHSKAVEWFINERNRLKADRAAREKAAAEEREQIRLLSEECDRLRRELDEAHGVIR
jgi:hypothetical protein